MIMERITNNMLERKVDYLNKITGNNPVSYTRSDSGFKANIGNYHISGAYGGVALEQMTNESGGIHSVFSIGHVPKRELFDRICAYVDGIDAGKRLTSC